MSIKKIIAVQVVVIAIIGIGWVKNLIKLADCDFQAPYKGEVIHAVGLIPQIGAVTGWIDAGK